MLKLYWHYYRKNRSLRSLLHRKLGSECGLISEYWNYYGIMPRHCALLCTVVNYTDKWTNAREVSKCYFSKKCKSPERSRNNPVSGVIEWLRQPRPVDVQENKISQNLRNYKRLTEQAHIFNVDSARSQQYLRFGSFQHIFLSCFTASSSYKIGLKSQVKLQ